MDSQLLHGDALRILRTLPDASFDAVVTDPPYSSGGQSAAERTRSPQQKYQQSGQQHHWANFEGETMDQRSWSNWCREWLTEARRVTVKGGVLCVFSDWRQLPAMSDALQQAGWRWMGVAVWDKTSACRPQLGRFSHQAEYVLWAGNGMLPKFREICHEGTTLRGVFHYRNEQIGKKLHMTGKPLELMHEICGVVKPGGRVLDPFAGSGTTLLAAHNRALTFVGIEKDEHYYHVAKERLEKESVL